MLDVAIVGGGPAGLTAGMYCARGGAGTVVFESMIFGGQAAITHWIENFPGFPEGIAGLELGERLAEQAKKFGAAVRLEEVLSLTPKQNYFHLATDSGGYDARAVILCMGATPRKLGLPQEARLTGVGVSYCATCDGAFFRNRPVAVVGGGDTAVADAIFLSAIASEVHLIHRRDELRAARRYADAVKAEPKVHIHWNSVVEDIEGKDRVEGVILTNVHSAQRKRLKVDAVFIAAGIMLNTALVKDLLVLGQDGGIQTDSMMRTSVAGIYAAGDVRANAIRQNVTAAADGATAAMDALLNLYA